MTRNVLFAISALTLPSFAASPATAQVDPVARAMAAQALSVASAQTTMKTTIVGGEQPNTPAVSGASGTIGNSPIQATAAPPTTPAISRSNTARTARG
ncbi:hypothetical protein [Sphingomonas faeni]|uniref:hypothetical protein n=1 Tax=Sphingomonas faeni TaxID=185950 RepID=UPI0024139D61|nr:hypothetical protein [Sphingomonas faeni]